MAITFRNSALTVSFCVVILLTYVKDILAEQQFSEEEEKVWREAKEKFQFKDTPEMDEDEIQHLKEHIKDAEVDVDKLSQEELAFYYFQVHDSNHDGQLDGLELLKALEHTALLRVDKTAGRDQYYSMETEAGRFRWQGTFRGFVRNVDNTLENDDLDKNGYLTYPEYANSRRLWALKRKV